MLINTRDRMKKKIERTKIKLLTYAKTIKFLIYIECKTKTSSSMIVKNILGKSKI